MKEYDYKNKDGKFIWRNNQIKVVFRDVSFQAHDDYAYVKNIDDIRFLYYTVEIYIKKYYFDKNNDEKSKWELFVERRAYDFPTITELQYILKEYIEDTIPLEDYRKVHYYHRGEEIKDMVGYVHSMSTIGIIYDDAYSVEKTIIKEKGKTPRTHYDLYFGVAIDVQGGGSSKGVTAYVTDNGIRLLYQCVNEFLDYAISKHNNAVRSHLTNNDYIVDEHNRLIKLEDGKMEEMFLENEKVDSIDFYVGDLNSEDFHSEDYHNITLSSFTKDTVTFTGGYCDSGDNSYNELEVEDRVVTIPVKNIISIWASVNENILKMNEEDIAENLKRVLTQEELDEIKNSSTEDMDEKWSEIIIDRYTIFREHPFRKIKKDEHKNSREAVKTIISLLQNL